MAFLYLGLGYITIYTMKQYKLVYIRFCHLYCGSYPLIVSWVASFVLALSERK